MGTGYFLCSKEDSLYLWIAHQKIRLPLFVAFFVDADKTSEKVACPLLLFAIIMDNKEKIEIK